MSSFTLTVTIVESSWLRPLELKASYPLFRYYSPESYWSNHSGRGGCFEEGVVGEERWLLKWGSKNLRARLPWESSERRDPETPRNVTLSLRNSAFWRDLGFSSHILFEFCVRRGELSAWQSVPTPKHVNVLYTLFV